MNKQEEFQNRALAKLLSERGVAADYEQRGQQFLVGQVSLAKIRQPALLSQDPHLESPEHRLIREALESQWPELVGEVS